MWQTGTDVILMGHGCMNISHMFSLLSWYRDNNYQNCLEDWKHIILSYNIWASKLYVNIRYKIVSCTSSMTHKNSKVIGLAHATYLNITFFEMFARKKIFQNIWHFSNKSHISATWINKQTNKSKKHQQWWFGLWRECVCVHVSIWEYVWACLICSSFLCQLIYKNKQESG